MRNDWQQTSVLAAAAFERINQHAQYYPPDNSRFYQYTRGIRNTQRNYQTDNNTAFD